VCRIVVKAGTNIAVDLMGDSQMRLPEQWPNIDCHAAPQRSASGNKASAVEANKDSSRRQLSDGGSDLTPVSRSMPDSAVSAAGADLAGTRHAPGLVSAASDAGGAGTAAGRARKAAEADALVQEETLALRGGAGSIDSDGANGGGAAIDGGGGGEHADALRRRYGGSNTCSRELPAGAVYMQEGPKTLGPDAAVAGASDLDFDAWRRQDGGCASAAGDAPAGAAAPRVRSADLRLHHSMA